MKTREQLDVELPGNNANFHTLAQSLAVKLPNRAMPDRLPSADAAREWQRTFQLQFARVLMGDRSVARVPKTPAAGGKLKSNETHDAVEANFWEFRAFSNWSIPVVEFVRGEPKEATIVIADAGRKSAAAEVERLVAAGQRVLAVDLFYFGESKVAQKDYLFALLVSAVGRRPLAIQASQLNAVARAVRSRHKVDSVHVVAIGPRSSLIALAATTFMNDEVDEDWPGRGDEDLPSRRPRANRNAQLPAGLSQPTIASLELYGCWGSLKEVIEQNWSVEQAPEVFCFGLLKQADIGQLIAAAAPRRVVIRQPSERAKKELSGLKAWYVNFGVDFDPLQ